MSGPHPKSGVRHEHLGSCLAGTSDSALLEALMLVHCLSVQNWHLISKDRRDCAPTADWP